ncbi:MULTISPECIES: periplasmic heavy metal sensor [unclassified Sphingomonas]|uniref:periplasmic heavy metal sensor n=1 Tax=Novosphingobium rhizosphaerae TaxID=1551649 RepID=UPI0015C7D310
MTPRTLKVVCAVSVLLNLFLLAAIASASLWLKLPQARINAGSIRIAGSELPADERKAFRHMLHQARHDMRPQILAGRAARHEAAILLRAPVVDQPALLAALQKVRDSDVAVRTHVEAKAVPFVAALPLADRAKLADGLEPKGQTPGK